jgi:hypothetical protein
MTYILRSANVLNFMLLLGILLTTFFVLQSLNVKEDYTRSPKTVSQADTKPKAEMLPTEVKQTDYMVIADQNPFHPDRRIPPAKKDAKKMPKPDVVLYGTLLTDNLCVAYVEDKNDPYSTPGRGNRQITLKKGDTISGYLLKEIEATRIVLVRGDETLVVSLDDHTKKRMAESTPPIPSVPAGITAPQARPFSVRPPLSGRVPAPKPAVPPNQQPPVSVKNE